MTSTPIYATERAKVYQGRAEDVLPQLQRDSVDLVVTDPPYGTAWRSGRGQNFEQMVGDDGSLDLDAVLVEACRVLRPRRHLYVFGGLGFGSAPIGGATELVWDKAIPGSGDLSCPWAPSHERIDFGVLTPSPANRAGGDGRLAARLRRGSVLRVPRLNSQAVRRHPAEKPVALLRQLVESSSCLGEVVLDPFVGCGSTAVAAILAGRRFVGVELDPGYAAQAAERCAAAEKIVDQQEGI